MGKLKSILIIICYGYCVYSQSYYGNNWVLGYGSNESETFRQGKVTIKFSESPILTSYSSKGKDFPLFYSVSSISDKSGELLFYSDNMHLVDNNHDLLENGDSINPGIMRDLNLGSFYPLQTACFFLPDPGNSNRYYFIHKALDLTPDGFKYPTYSNVLYYSLIEINKQHPKGIVLTKNQPLIYGNFVESHLAACKHGNGRDWWIVLEESGTNKHFFFLLTPSGIGLSHEQKIGFTTSIDDWNGDCVFSQNGYRYVKSTVADQIQIFDFDRCNGYFSNPKHLVLNSTKLGSTLMISLSPNGNLLYASISSYIFQFDLTSNDILKTIDTVGVWDRYYYQGKFNTAFFQMKLAVNNKIYISCKAGGPYLHVIERPDLKGKDCRLIQRAVTLPCFYAFGLPTMPNYNLGAEEGSVCDYLGTKDLVQCDWNYERVDRNSKTLKFFDQSLKPTSSWYWDFGDGTFSNQPNPDHTYMISGVYNVCLSVLIDNNRVSRKCKSIAVGALDSSNNKINLSVVVSPSVFDNYININLNDYNYNDMYVEFFDNLGRFCFRRKLNDEYSRIETGQLHHSGQYYLSIKSSGKNIYSTRIIKIN